MSRMQEKIINNPTIAVAGIDVGKNQLDVFIHPANIRLKISNDKRAIRTLIRELTKHDIALVTLEATGKYHVLAHGMIHDSGIGVSVVNPFRSRQFADSMGKLAKTDTIDAEVLAHFALRMQPEPSVPLNKQIKILRDLHAARRQIVQETADLKRKLQTTDNTFVVRQIKSRIAMGERHKASLENEIHTAISSCPELQEKFNILTSIPNVGKITAATMLADLAELGQVNAKEIAALVGVAPMNWDSGAKHGNRMIRGGRKSVRNALYMCAVSSIKRSDVFGQTYRNLIRRGKNPKVALTAVMRKIVIVANTLITERRHWEESPPITSCMPFLSRVSLELCDGSAHHDFKKVA